MGSWGWAGNSSGTPGPERAHARALGSPLPTLSTCLPLKSGRAQSLKDRSAPGWGAGLGPAHPRGPLASLPLPKGDLPFSCLSLGWTASFQGGDGILWSYATCPGCRAGSRFLSLLCEPPSLLRPSAVCPCTTRGLAFGLATFPVSFPASVCLSPSATPSASASPTPPPSLVSRLLEAA